MTRFTVDLTMPARPAFSLDAVERRFALYVSDKPLPLSLRGNRARLAALVELGIDRVGRDCVKEMAQGYRYLSEQARTTGCPTARARALAVWPDRKRAQVARVLATSPAWPVVG
jgi:phytoene/squalene synthetase